MYVLSEWHYKLETICWVINNLDRIVFAQQKLGNNKERQEKNITTDTLRRNEQVILTSSFNYSNYLTNHTRRKDQKGGKVKEHCYDMFVQV